MTSYVVHKTSGPLDLRALDCFGVNSKPRSSSPFGYFGTGLKYAIAVLSRLEIPTLIFTNGNNLVFEKEPEDFRGRTVDFVVMKDWTTDEVLQNMPYTTELGKDWELWQVFRELHSNTLDEGGETLRMSSMSEVKDFVNEQGPDCTLIVVGGDDYAAVMDDMGRIFLPGGLSELSCSDEKIQILDSESHYVYYRGVRVLDLRKPSILTYNFISEIELTEDRTAKDIYSLEHEIKRTLLASRDESLVAKVVECDERFWESEFNYDYSPEPSETFLSAVRVARAPTAGAQRRASSSELRRRVRNPLEDVPRPWRAGLLPGGAGVVLRDANGHEFVRISGELRTEEIGFLLYLLEQKPTFQQMEAFLRLEEAEGVDWFLEGTASDLSKKDDDVPF
ncbi:MAG: hypothetical protein AB7V46_18175 [Thermomicrobiales bacterium]